MKLKLAGFLAVLLLGLGLVNQAQAAITLRDWAQSPQAVGDKLFTLLGYEAFADDFQIDIFNVGQTFVLTGSPPDDPGFLADPGTYILDYTIEITEPDQVFRTVEADSDFFGPITFTKFVDSEEANLGNGGLATLVNKDGPDLIFGGLTKLWVRDVVEISADDVDKALFSFSNTFTQAVVPEPASIVSFGGLALLMGLVMLRRRKRS
jgi:hypothetical protein